MLLDSSIHSLDYVRCAHCGHYIGYVPELEAAPDPICEMCSSPDALDVEDKHDAAMQAHAETLTPESSGAEVLAALAGPGVPHNSHIIDYCLDQCNTAVGDDHPARWERWTDKLCIELYQLNDSELARYFRH